MRIWAIGIWRMSVVRRQNDEVGFTLLEIMVVLLIIGIMMSMAVLSIGSQDRAKGVQNEMLRMQGLFTLAAEEAVFGVREWGVKFGLHGYEFLVQDEKNKWQKPAFEERLLKPRHWPDEILMTLQVEGETLTNEVKPEDPPQLIFSSDGEKTPFQLDLELPANHLESVRFRLTGGMNGVMRMERVTKL